MSDMTTNAQCATPSAVSAMPEKMGSQKKAVKKLTCSI